MGDAHCVDTCQELMKFVRSERSIIVLNWYIYSLMFLLHKTFCRCFAGICFQCETNIEICALAAIAVHVAMYTVMYTQVRAAIL